MSVCKNLQEVSRYSRQKIFRSLMLVLSALAASGVRFTSEASCAQSGFQIRSVRTPSCAAALSSVPNAAECGDVESQLATVAQATTPLWPWQRWRIALCFYSLTRSLRLTLPSIERHVLRPLKAGRTSVEIFLHTYNMSRAGCNGCAGSVQLSWEADVAALSAALPRGVPLRVQVDDQSLLIRRLGSEHAHAFATVWRSDGEAVGVEQFYVAALHSLKRVTAMWHDYARHGEPYHLVCMLRPDLVYLDPLPAAWLLAASARDASFLAVPPRLFKAGRWVDDKFAIGAPRAALVYGNRVDALMAFMRAHPKKLSECYGRKLCQCAADERDARAKSQAAWDGRGQLQGHPSRVWHRTAVQAVQGWRSRERSRLASRNSGAGPARQPLFKALCLVLPAPRE